LDVRQIVRVRRLSQEYLVYAGNHPFDRVDALAADICTVLKRHGERFESDEQLEGWLAEGGISCTAEELDKAMQQLEFSGRIRRPRQDQWRSDLPLPGQYVEPRPFNE
jgi:hypothetical protein